MYKDRREGEILRAQNLLQAIEQPRQGLIEWYNFFQHHNNQLNERVDFDALVMEFQDDDAELAQNISDDYLETEVKKAHDRFCALIQELKNRKNLELTKLLKP